MVKLAYYVSHPIQYQAPLLRRIAREPDIDLEVFFGSDFSLHAHAEKNFGRSVRWDVDLLSDYKHDFLPQLWKAKETGPFSPFNFGLGRRLRKGNFDALWVHGYLHPTNLLAMAEAFRRGIRVLVRDEAHLQGRVNTHARVKRAVIDWQLRNGAMYLAIGSANAAFYRTLGVPEDRISLMPYAVDNVRFQEQAQAAAERVHELRGELNLERHRPVILYAGKFIPVKGVDLLIRAYSKLPRDNGEPRPYLVLVGGGPLRAELEQLAVQSGVPGVRFAGFKNQTELPAYFSLSTLLALPSNYEPWGLIVNEAMSCGRPTVVSDVAGCCPDLIEDGVTGYRFRSGDADHLAEVLLKATKDPEHARSMGQASLKRMSTWDYEADVRGIRDALTRLYPDRLNGLPAATTTHAGVHADI